LLRDPDKMPDRYATICIGTCLEPVIPDGSTVVFDRHEPIVNGDFVCVIVRPEKVPPGEHPGMLKRLYLGAGAPLGDQISPQSELMPLIVLEMLNPPRLLSIAAQDVIAMHKAVGLAETRGNGWAKMLPLPDWYRPAGEAL